MSSFIINASISFNPDRDVNPITLAQYIGSGSGPLSHSHILTTGYFTSQYAKDSGEGHWPDIQVIFGDVAMTKDGPSMVEKLFNLKTGVMEKYLHDTLGNDSFIAIVGIGRPKSRGEVLLDKDNLFGYPLVNPRYYSDPRDMQRMVEGN